jgi:hypothetical protein
MVGGIDRRFIKWGGGTGLDINPEVITDNNRRKDRYSEALVSRSEVFPCIGKGMHLLLEWLSKIV